MRWLFSLVLLPACHTAITPLPPPPLATTVSPEAQPQRRYSFPKELASARVIAVGDLLIHNNVKNSAKAAAQTDETGASVNHEGWSALFEHVDTLIADADIAFANLETPVAPDNHMGTRSMVFNAPAVLLPALSEVGFDILSFANNHVYDQGRPGLVETIERLEAAPLEFAGAGHTCAEAQAHKMLEANGIRIAFLAASDLFNDNLNLEDDVPCSFEAEPEAMIAAAKNAREAGADVVVLSIHWGREYRTRPEQEHIDMAHTLMAEYLLGGPAAFYRHGEAMVLHLMDVDVVHDHAGEEPLAELGAPAMWAARPQLPSGVPQGISTGAVRAFGYSKHHNLTPVVDYKGLSPKAYLAFYHMTGDLDALETALAIGDYVARSSSGIGGRSSRAQAFPLAALMALYEETYDEHLLEAARRLFEDALSFGPRRGAYVEPMMSFEYMSNGGGMVTHLTEGMMMYWAASGDRRAAAAIVALASSVLAENTGGPESLPCYWERTAGGLQLLPEGQGERGMPGVTHYSGNPLQKNWAPEYVHQVCQGFAYAYDLTGKARFLEAARGGYEEAARLGMAHTMYAYWAAPVLLYYLDAFAED